MKRGVRFALILMAFLLAVACKSAPETQEDSGSSSSDGRTKEEAEAKHAELIRKQEELKRRYGGQQENQSGEEQANA